MTNRLKQSCICDDCGARHNRRNKEWHEAVVQRQADRAVKIAAQQQFREEYKETLIKLCNEGKNVVEIAAVVDRVPNTIGKALSELGLKATRVMRPKDIQRRQEIIKYYNSEPMTLETCGQHFGITRERVRQILKDASVETASARISCRRERIKEFVEEHLDLSSVEIAEHFGLSNGCVAHDLKRLKIPRDLVGMRRRLCLESKRHGRVELTKELLKQEYIDNDLSQTQISEKYGYAQTGIANKLRHYGLQKSAEQIGASISKNYGRQTGRIR